MPPRQPTIALSADAGQASVELVALVPALLVVAALAWQVVLAGHTLISGTRAARAAARAAALGGDAERAARRVLPRMLEERLDVRAASSGGVMVRLHIPAVLGDGSIAPVTVRARFDGGHR